jgi:hypothetical protein
MKLTNLSLAIMVAVGVAACGGSDDDNSNKPADPPKPNQPQTDNNNNNKPTPPAENPKVVDPTGTHVVDNKDLTKENTVGTLQYIRRDGSQYDRANNPSKPASASPLLGVTLNDQNPKLTNIVFARQNLQREDGKAVKAQFGGMDNPVPLDKETGNVYYDSLGRTQPDGGRSLQEENFANVDTLAPYGKVNAATDKAGQHFNADNVIRGATADLTRKDLAVTGVQYDTVSTSGNTKGERVINTTADVTAVLSVPKKEYVIDEAISPNHDLKMYNPEGIDGGKDGEPRIGTATTYAPGTYPVVGGTYDGVVATLSDPTKKPVYSKVDKKGKEYFKYATEKYTPVFHQDPANRGKFVVEKKDLIEISKASDVNTLFNSAASADKATASRLGYGLVWWSAPVTTFENSFSRGEGSHPDFDLTGTTADAFERDGKAATTGLVRVGGGLETLGQEQNYNSTTKKWEDHHNTTTRIFGRYHLATAFEKDGTKDIKQVNYNTFNGARAFTAGWKTEHGASGDKTYKAALYSIGATPSTLQYVQYGRVSNQLDLDAGKEGYPDGFVRNYFSRKGADDTVDNYFYRGTNATTIEQMAALPSNQIAVYNGHALMYGINNDYHEYTKTADGKKQPLPNAFAPSGSNDAAKPERLGLGNFVTVAANFGTKRVSGEVYNAWLLDPSKSDLTNNTLVQFAGDIVGNTVVGVADRTYVDGRDDATFKASFFGEQAQEIGGSFNSVKDNDKYASAYGTDDWGGVFGATKGASNTFQGDDGANVYGGATQRQ